jgi:hypothetical protein
MPQNLTSLLNDLQVLVKELDDAQKNKNEPEQGQTPTREPADQAAAPEPDPAAASTAEIAHDNKGGEVNDLTIKTDGTAAGVVIGVNVDETSPVKLERFEVTPEPDGRVRITVSAKKKEL